jgi:amidase
MTRADITDLDAVALAAAIASRAVSCVEVMTAYLDRIDRLNPQLNAIVNLRDRAPLLAEAREHDAQLARGDAIGPLHGFPHAVKDVTATAGIRTTFGSPLYRDFVPEQDAIVVQRLKRAGAIVIGKTNVPEFGLGSHTFNEVFGVTRNPYDPSRSAGGSSGGAAAALASRLLPLADGSDYAGSLRNPAAWNNVFSLRTSPGLVPRDTPDLFFPAPSVIGPMARTVPDLALLLSVLAGRDPAVPLSQPVDPRDFAAPLDADLAGLRVAWCGAFGGHLPFESGALELCEAALRAVADLGCVVEPAMPNFPLDRLWRDWLTLRSWHTASNYAALYRDPAKRARLKEEMIWEIERGLALSGQHVAQASQGRSDWYRAVTRLFAAYDVLLLPSAQLFPFPVEWRWPQAIAGRAMDSYHRWMENNIVVTMSACPALNVPVGFDARGLPMGMQIVAPIGGERRLLQIAQGYDRATRWSAHQPPLARGG